LLECVQHLCEELLRVNVGQRSFVHFAAPSRGPNGVDYVAGGHDVTPFRIMILI
jgi:hypothetical protein